MKLFIHYEDHASKELHKTSKITLPKKWLSGHCTALLELFVKTYNGKFAENQLDIALLHLENEKGEALANECVVSEFVAPAADVYVRHGPPPGVKAVTAARVGGTVAAPVSPVAQIGAAAGLKTPDPQSAGGGGGLLQCKRFGCQKKFDPSTNHETACSYHRLPPVFHETAKFWACCPDQKCYSWDSFMQVHGCSVGPHTHLKPDQPSVLGGCDVRSGNDGSHEAQEKLKSIEEYNAERRHQGGGAGEAIAQMYQLRQVMEKAGIPGALFDRAKEAVSGKQNGDPMATSAALVARISQCLEAIADAEGMAEGSAP